MHVLEEGWYTVPRGIRQRFNGIATRGELVCGAVHTGRLAPRQRSAMPCLHPVQTLVLTGSSGTAQQIHRSEHYSPRMAQHSHSAYEKATAACQEDAVRQLSRGSLMPGGIAATAVTRAGVP